MKKTLSFLYLLFIFQKLVHAQSAIMNNSKTMNTYNKKTAETKKHRTYKNIENSIITNDDDGGGSVDASSSKIMFLNAYNFDFGQTKLNSNYVGHLNLFAPSIDNTNWGFNTGIMKINYGIGDTLGTERKILENVRINPLDILKDSSKYLRQYNNYKTQTQSSAWSFYVQSLYELTDKKKKQHIYWHVHAELLSEKYSATTTITTIQQDTAYYISANHPVVRTGSSNSNTYTLNSLAGYFGTGFTFDLNPWDGGKFFFQPTFGFTSNRFYTSSQSDIFTLNHTWNSFYLIRAYFMQTISKPSTSTIVFGVDIRGFFPIYAPQNAAYVGLNIGLDAITKLITN